MLVVWLQNHSLQKRALHPFLKNKDISSQTHVKKTTVASILRNWRNTHCDILKLVAKRGGPKFMLSEGIMRNLTNPKTLREMAHLSLRQRVELIKKEHRLTSLSPTTLMNIYLRANVTFRKPNYF